MYYVNDGVYGSFNCLLFDHAEIEPNLLEVCFCHSTVDYWWIGHVLFMSV